MEVREILVTTIEEAGSDPKIPIVKTDLKVLDIDAPVMYEEKPYVQPGTLARRYRINIKLVAGLEARAFAGDISVIDPWHPTHVEQLRVHAEVRPPFKAIPSRVILRATGKETGGLASSNVLILSQEPLHDLVIEADQNPPPFILSRPQSDAEGLQHSFTVTLKADLISAANTPCE